MKTLKKKFLALVLLFIFALFVVELKKQSMKPPEVSFVEDPAWSLQAKQKESMDEIAKNLKSQANFLGFISGYRQVIEQILDYSFVESAKTSWTFGEPLKIKVQAHSAFAMMLKKGNWFLLNHEGEVLRQVSSDQTLDLPIISSEKILKDKKLKLEALDLLKKLKNFDAGLDYKRLSEINFDERGLFVIFSPNYKVYLSSKNFEKQSRRLKEVFKYLELRDLEVDFVDAKFANKVLVRPKQKDHMR